MHICHASRLSHTPRPPRDAFNASRGEAPAVPARRARVQAREHPSERAQPQQGLFPPQPVRPPATKSRSAECMWRSRRRRGPAWGNEGQACAQEGILLLLTPSTLISSLSGLPPPPAPPMEGDPIPDMGPDDTEVRPLGQWQQGSVWGQGGGHPRCTTLCRTVPSAPQTHATAPPRVRLRG